MNVEIQRLRDELKRGLRNLRAHLFGYTNIAASSALGDKDALESVDDATDPGTSSKGQRPVARIQPFGFASRPPSKLRALALFLGDSNPFLLGIAPQQKYGPQALNVGETALYNSLANVEVLLDKNGAVTITDGGGNTAKLDGSGNWVLQHLASVQSGAPPTTSDGAHMTIDATSTDRSGLFTLQGLSAGVFTIDVTYAKPYPNGSRVFLFPANQAGADNSISANSGGGTTGMNQQVYVDASNTTKSKFRVTNKTTLQSTSAPGGQFYYLVDGY